MQISTEKKVETEFQIGPMSILQHAVTNHHQILVSCRNNKKLLGHVKAFDRHMNLIMENVREMWKEIPRKGKGKRSTVNKDRFISKMFLRGDSIILVMKNPLGDKEDEEKQREKPKK